MKAILTLLACISITACSSTPKPQIDTTGIEPISVLKPVVAYGEVQSIERVNTFTIKPYNTSSIAIVAAGNSDAVDLNEFTLKGRLFGFSVDEEILPEDQREDLRDDIIGQIEDNIEDKLSRFFCWGYDAENNALCAINRNGEDFVLYMLKNGIGYYDQSEGKHPFYHKKYVQAEASAKANKMGMWMDNPNRKGESLLKFDIGESNLKKHKKNLSKKAKDEAEGKAKAELKRLSKRVF